MAQRKKFSLQNKFILISLLNLFFPLFLMIWLSYTKSVEIIERQVSQSNFNTVEQVAENLNLVFQDMKNSSIFLLQNHEFMNYMRLSAEEVADNPNYILAVQKFINNYLAFNTNIHSIYLDAFNGIEFDSASAYNNLDDDLRQKLTLLRGEGILLPDEITNYNGTKTKVFTFVKMLKDTDNLANDLAILKINISETSITNVFNGKLLNESGGFMLIDGDGIVISPFLKDGKEWSLEPEHIDPSLYSGENGYTDILIDGEKYLLTYHSLFYPNWKLINLVPLRELSKDISVIRNITALSVTLSIAFCAAAMAYFLLKALGPLRELRKAMMSLKDGNFNVSIPVRGNDEIAELAVSFNKMLQRLDELVNEILAGQIKQQEAELKVLYAQINPHFLYNTLDMIYWTARLEKAEESAALIQTLSKLFRLSLNNGNEFTTLARELEHLKLYIAIQEKRLADSIKFNTEIEDGLMECKVIKLILQPFVENAILHGAGKNSCQGVISVKITRDADTLVYVIEDDGDGAVEGEMYSHLNHNGEDGHGFAVSNINQRIRIYYGGKYGVAFKTAPGCGMRVTVTQPIVKE